MNQSLILPGSSDAGGITTERYTHVGRKGDLVVELHFGAFSDPRKREAAFFLFAGNRARGMYVPLSTMWQFAEKDALHTVARLAAEQIYGVATRDDCFRVLDAVLDYLDDLKNSPMPPVNQDRSLDAFLAKLEEDTEGGHMFIERGGERIKLGH